MARCLVLTKLPSAERKGLYFSLQVYKLIKDYLTERNEMFMTAIEVVLHDEGFDFPSDSAKNARKTASDLLPWCKDDVNIEALTSFVTEIFALFDRCINCSKRKVSHSKHVEKIWGSFHSERCMPAYASSWSTFLEISINTTISADPIFFQFITDQMFKIFLKQTFTFDQDSQSQPHCSSELGYEEQNIVRFIAGYLLRSLTKRLTKSADPLKKEMLLCLKELQETEGGKSEDSSDWVRLRDRGGLTHVSKTTFLLLSSMEVIVKQHTSKELQDFNEKGVLTEKILSSDEVDLYWESLSVNWDDRASSTLLGLIVDQWITIRGFAYASNWMEMYKRSTKKKVQKSKGIRKTLIGLGSTTESTTSENHD